MPSIPFNLEAWQAKPTFCAAQNIQVSSNSTIYLQPGRVDYLHGHQRQTVGDMAPSMLVVVGFSSTRMSSMIY